MGANDQVVAAFHRKIAAWGLGLRALSALTAWAFVWGTGALLLRLTTSLPTEALLWGAAGAPVVAAAAAWLGRRSIPDIGRVRAYLDSRSECGGLLMAAAERDLGRWSVNLPSALPRFQWRAGRPLGAFAFSLAYLGLCLLTPIEPQLLGAEARLDVGRETDRLARQVQVLKEEKILDSDRAENLKQKLDQVREQAEAKGPAKSLEALDHLNDVMRQSARQAAEAAAREAAELGKIEAGAEAIPDAADSLGEAATASLMKDLAAMAKKAAAERNDLKEELDGDLAADLAAGKLSKEQLGKLAAAARAANGKVKKRAKNLFDARLIDSDELKECEGNCPGGKELADFLKKNGCKGGLCDALDGSMPGRGGVSEGPGAAELQFGERSSAEGAKFREEALPPGGLDALKESQATGVSSTAPQKDKSAPAPKAGGLSGAAAGGGSANAAPVLPQHKGAVGRYFDRPAK